MRVSAKKPLRRHPEGGDEGDTFKNERRRFELAEAEGGIVSNDTIPVGEETIPEGEETIPVGEETIPVGEETILAALRAAVAARAAASSAPAAVVAAAPAASPTTVFFGDTRAAGGSRCISFE